MFFGKRSDISTKRKIFIFAVASCCCVLAWTVVNVSEPHADGEGWVTVLSPPNQQKLRSEIANRGAASSEKIPAEPPKNVRDPSKEDEFKVLQQKVADQPRDALWAAATESGIRTALQEIPYLTGRKELRVLCGSNMCQASGIIIANASWYNAEIAQRYITEKSFSEVLVNYNALTDKIILDKTTGKFMISFTRIRR